MCYIDVLNDEFPALCAKGQEGCFRNRLFWNLVKYVYKATLCYLFASGVESREFVF